MKKYFAKMTIGAGMYSCEIIEAVSEECADEEARILCIDLADSYGFQQDEDFFGDLDSVGRDWDEEEQYYEDEGFLDYYVEEYDPEEHDDEIC